MKELQILNLPTTLTWSEVLKQAPKQYKKLSSIFHPDNLETGNQEKFIKIKLAYEKVIDKKAYYESQNKAGNTATPTKVINEIWNEIIMRERKD